MLEQAFRLKIALRLKKKKTKKEASLTCVLLLKVQVGKVQYVRGDTQQVCIQNNHKSNHLILGQNDYRENYKLHSFSNKWIYQQWFTDESSALLDGVAWCCNMCRFPLSKSCGIIEMNEVALLYNTTWPWTLIYQGSFSLITAYNKIQRGWIEFCLWD